MAVLSLDDQLAIFDRDFHKAYLRVKTYLDKHEATLYKLGRETLINKHGEFGDASWHRSPNELLLEVVQELVDAPIWKVIEMNSTVRR